MHHALLEGEEFDWPLLYMDQTGKKRRYTGDLLIHFRSKTRRRPLVVECKYAEKLKRDPALVEKLELVGNAMQGYSRDFLIQTEHDIHDESFKMMNFIFGYRNNDAHPAEQEIMDCMNTHQNLTLSELVSVLRTKRVQQTEDDLRALRGGGDGANWLRRKPRILRVKYGAQGARLRDGNDINGID